MHFIGSWSSPSLLEIAGLVSWSYILIYRPAKFLLGWMWNNCFTCSSRKILVPGVNFYAVITGATDGIGLEYAKQLAQKGFNLVLLSRTEEKLQRVAREILEQYPTCQKIEHLAVDFSSVDIYDKIQAKLESLDGPIHVLVNNVGTAYNIPEYFANFPPGLNLRIINTNIVSVTRMCEIVIKLMQRQHFDSKINPARGVIINISSAAGATEIPMFSTYSASKSFMNYLSKILSTEYAKDNIIVQTVTPNQVDTKLARDLYNDFMTVSPESYVRYALKTVGNEQQTNAHPKHKIIYHLSTAIGWLVGDSLFMKMKMSFGIMAREEYDERMKAQGRDPLLNSENAAN